MNRADTFLMLSNPEFMEKVSSAAETLDLSIADTYALAQQVREWAKVASAEDPAHITFYALAYAQPYEMMKKAGFLGKLFSRAKKVRSAPKVNKPSSSVIPKPDTPAPTMPPAPKPVDGMFGRMKKRHETRRLNRKTRRQAKNQAKNEQVQKELAAARVNHQRVQQGQPLVEKPPKPTTSTAPAPNEATEQTKKGLLSKFKALPTGAKAAVGVGAVGAGAIGYGAYKGMRATQHPSYQHPYTASPYRQSQYR